jgi:hypothetical protein
MPPTFSPIDIDVSVQDKSGSDKAHGTKTNLYRCVLSHIQPKGLEDAPLFVVVEVVERLTGPDGQELLIPDMKVSTLWTNLPDSEAVCVQLCHNRGTRGQFPHRISASIYPN